jgi:hypothetical protein
MIKEFLAKRELYLPQEEANGNVLNVILALGQLKASIDYTYHFAVAIPSASRLGASARSLVYIDTTQGATIGQNDAQCLDCDLLVYSSNNQLSCM